MQESKGVEDDIRDGQWLFKGECVGPLRMTCIFSIGGSRGTFSLPNMAANLPKCSTRMHTSDQATAREGAERA